MLTQMRQVTETWVGRTILSIALGLLIISFSIWGIDNFFNGSSAGAAASVGQSNVSATSFRRAYEARQQVEKAAGAGLDRVVMNTLVADAALTERARTWGMVLSQAQIEKLVVDDPMFKNPNGAFDMQTLKQNLGAQGYTPKDLASYYLRRQIEVGIAGGVKTPKPVLELYNRIFGEKRAFQYLVLTDTAAGELPKPGEADLRKYFEAHKESFRLHEYRKILVLAVTPAALAKPDAVADADARKLYDEQNAAGRNGEAERRSVQQATFASEADAKAAAAKIHAGASFADGAAQSHGALADLGTQPERQLGDVAETAFALALGAVSDPVRVAKGYALVRVTKILPATSKPFAAVVAQLKRQIAEARVTTAEIEKRHETIESLLRTSGKPLIEAAKGASLVPREIEAIDSAGRDRTGALVPGLVDGPALLRAVFASDAGGDNETIQPASGGYEWFEITKVEPARDRAFAEVKSEVEARWGSAERAKALSAKSTELLRKLNTGTPPAALVPNADLKTAEGVLRTDVGKLPQNLVTEVFSTPPGGAGVVQGEGDSRILFKVVSVTPPAFDADSATIRGLSANLTNRMGSEILSQYASKLENDFGLKVNQSALKTSGEDTQPSPLDQN